MTTIWMTMMMSPSSGALRNIDKDQQRLVRPSGANNRDRVRGAVRKRGRVMDIISTMCGTYFISHRSIDVDDGIVVLLYALKFRMLCCFLWCLGPLVSTVTLGHAT